MKCPKCGYEWSYGGNLMRATCPNCGTKSHVNRKEK